MIWTALLTLLLVFFGNFAFGQTKESASSNNDIPILTVCEVLQNLNLYNGKSLIVIGKAVATDEGSWICAECESSIITDGYTWGNFISTRYILRRSAPPPSLPQNYRWDDEALLTKLKTLKGYSAPLDANERIAAMFGRLETRVPPQVVQYPNGSVKGLGFGHQSSSIAQLISCGVNCYHLLKRELDTHHSGRGN
jgi:hypothetical protein